MIAIRFIFAKNKTKRNFEHEFSLKKKKYFSQNFQPNILCCKEKKRKAGRLPMTFLSLPDRGN